MGKINKIDDDTIEETKEVSVQYSKKALENYKERVEAELTEVNRKYNGEKVTDFMKEKKSAQNSTIIIHSSNEPARQRMKGSLSEYHKNVHVIPFTELYEMKRDDFKS